MVKCEICNENEVNQYEMYCNDCKENEKEIIQLFIDLEIENKRVDK